MNSLVLLQCLHEVLSPHFSVLNISVSTDLSPVALLASSQAEEPPSLCLLFRSESQLQYWLRIPLITKTHEFVHIAFGVSLAATKH